MGQCFSRKKSEDPGAYPGTTTTSTTVPKQKDHLQPSIASGASLGGGSVSNSNSSTNSNRNRRRRSRTKNPPRLGSGKQNHAVVVLPDTDQLSDDEWLDETEASTHRSMEDDCCYLITEAVVPPSSTRRHSGSAITTTTTGGDGTATTGATTDRGSGGRRSHRSQRRHGSRQGSSGQRTSTHRAPVEPMLDDVENLDHATVLRKRKDSAGGSSGASVHTTNNNSTSAPLQKIREHPGGDDNSDDEPDTTVPPPNRASRPDDDDAPSDEEPTARRHRRRPAHHVVGRLSPVKLRTQWTPTPDSIHIRPTEVRTVPRTVSTDGRWPPKPATTDPPLDEAVASEAVSNFQKLKLQVAVSQQRAVQERRTAKVEERVKDVSGYKTLWKEYEQIQAIVGQAQTPTEPVDPSTLLPSSSSSRPGQTSPNKATDAEVEAAKTDQDKDETASTTSRRSFFRLGPKPKTSPKRPTKGTKAVAAAEQANPATEDDATSKTSRQSWIQRTTRRRPKTTPTVELDMEDDDGDASLRSWTSFGSWWSKPKKKTSRTDPDKTTDAHNKEGQETHKRRESFDLKNPDKWFFDFQDEFEPESENGAVTIGSNNSQASLSLLSESSMEAQRRFFMDKRRERKKKKKAPASTNPTHNTRTEFAFPSSLNGGGGAPAPSIELDLQDDGDVPLSRSAAKRSAKNQRKHAKRNKHKGQPKGKREDTTPKADSVSSNDYGPVRRRRSTATFLPRVGPPLLTDMEVVVTPDREDEDSASLVSDFDDTSLGRSRQESTHSHDYRVARRRPGGDAPSVDNSTIASDMDSLPDIPYDHNVVLQRRLDIEERLRALQRDDTDEECDPDHTLEAADKGVDQGAPDRTQQSVPIDQTLQSSYCLPAVISPDNGYRQHKRDAATGHESPVAMASMRTGVVTPLALDKEHTADESAELNQSVDQREPPRLVPSGKPPRTNADDNQRSLSKASKPKDYRKLLAAALLESQDPAERHEQHVPSPESKISTDGAKNRLTTIDSNRNESPSTMYGYGPRTVARGLENKALALYPQQGLGVDQSFESVESQGMHTALPYLQSQTDALRMPNAPPQNTTDATMLTDYDKVCRSHHKKRRGSHSGKHTNPPSNPDPTPCSQHKRLHQPSGPDDETKETLLLAGKVEARVKAVLGQYRSEGSLSIPDGEPPSLGPLR